MYSGACTPHRNNRKIYKWLFRWSFQGVVLYVFNSRHRSKTNERRKCMKLFICIPWLVRDAIARSLNLILHNVLKWKWRKQQSSSFNPNATRQWPNIRMCNCASMYSHNTNSVSLTYRQHANIRIVFSPSPYLFGTCNGRGPLLSHCWCAGTMCDACHVCHVSHWCVDFV